MRTNPPSGAPQNVTSTGPVTDPRFFDYNPALTIKLQAQNRSVGIWIQGGGWDDYELAVSPQTLAEDSAALRSSVNRAITAADGTANLSGESGTDGLWMDLARVGHSLFHDAFSHTPLHKILHDLSPGRPIEVLSDDVSFPWEVLHPEDPANGSSLQFLGLNHFVSRRPKGFQAWNGSPILSGSPAITLFANRDLQAVREDETPFLWGLHEKGAIDLFQYGLDGEGARLVEDTIDSPVDVIHFACHLLEDKASKQDVLVVSPATRIRAVDVPRKPPDDIWRPHVFLNVCDSGVGSPFDAGDFVRVFLNRGAAAVLATECRVPDVAAAWFSKRFYSEFLEGKPVFEAILSVRRTMAADLRNPIGLFYSLWGIPHAQLLTITGGSIDA